VQQEIDRLQERGGSDSHELGELLVRKYSLIQRIDALI
jgi:hypothetical protein